MSLTPATRRLKEKEQRRRAILKASQQLFFKKGYQSVSVESIARKARISKGTVYLYFHSKEEIYARILMNDIEMFHEKLFDIIDESGTAADMLLQFSDFYIDFFLNDRELFRILMTFMLRADNLNFSGEMNKHLIRAVNRSVEMVDRILEHGFKSGEFYNKKDFMKGRNVVWGLLNGIISLHLFVGKESTREKRIRSNVREGLDVFINGLKAPVFSPGDTTK
jgi:AcrR family transcriptional regulator